jgi:hypothetical protein
VSWGLSASLKNCIQNQIISNSKVNCLTVKINHRIAQNAYMIKLEI